MPDHPPTRPPYLGKFLASGVECLYVACGFRLGRLGFLERVLECSNVSTCLLQASLGGMERVSWCGTGGSSLVAERFVTCFLLGRELDGSGVGLDFVVVAFQRGQLCAVVGNFLGNRVDSFPVRIGLRLFLGDLFLVLREFVSEGFDFFRGLYDGGF